VIQEVAKEGYSIKKVCAVLSYNRSRYYRQIKESERPKKKGHRQKQASDLRGRIRRDDIPNQELAEEIAATRNEPAVREIVARLEDRDKAIQSDCIKVLYEIGYRAPRN